MIKKVLVTVIALLTLVGVICAGFLYTKLNYKYEKESTLFTISPGQGFSKINYNLLKNEIIDDASFFYRYVMFKNKTSDFKAGTYKITTGMTLPHILEELTQGQPILTRITIPEGKNLYEVAKLIDAKNIASKENFIKMSKDKEFIKSLGIEGPTVEGYLYPETYNFAPKSGAKKAIRTMVHLFKIKTKELDFSKSFLNKHQVIILASIVEKETGASWERPTIAGVYLNRLKKPMRLQADPTTIYGIWESYKGNLRKRHLLQKTAYNTYKINGLPLGPIANPSLAAIKAVLEPKSHNFLYFVSKNDGTHIFTPTYKKHLEAVREFQLNRKNRTGKSWRDLKKN